MKRKPLKQGDVLPGNVLRDEYGMNAANRPVIEVDERQVPEHLRALIPAVERWAIPCDVTRGDYFDHQPEADIAAFWHETLPHVDAINEWLDQQPQKVADWPEAAVHFMYFLKAHGEAWQPTEEEKQAMEAGIAARRHELAFANATRLGLEAFQRKDFQAVVTAMEPFADQLDKVSAAKLK